MRKTATFIYYGEKYFNESEGVLGRLASEAAQARCEWQDIINAVQERQIVLIRPADANELSWAESNLLLLKTNKQSAPS